MSTLNEQTRIAKIRPIAAEHMTGDLVDANHPLFGVIWINPERLSGAPCFYGTRVPVKNLFDFLEGGDSLTEFLEAFPGVCREQAVVVLESARSGLLAELPKR